nr:hypothetical protein CFP56_18963 [Quercus suber]
MNRLNPLISGLHQEDAWMIVDFLDKAPICCITWEFDPTLEKVLHFGFFYRKIFRRVRKILYSYHKNHQFCGDVLSRMMVSQNLDVFHPYDGVRRFSDFAKGRKQMLDTLAGFWPWWLRSASK